jgi:mannose-6-phosphate isomerase-like protein (cupin superfamily)
MMSDKTIEPCEAFKESILEDHRPWGKFRRFPHEGVSSIKIITVNPGGILSLQFHHGRDEFWLVLDDGLEMTVGERVWRPAAGEEIWIPKETRHRVRGVGERPARVMELWIGPSEESDIVRLEDAYNRS